MVFLNLIGWWLAVYRGHDHWYWLYRLFDMDLEFTVPATFAALLFAAAAVLLAVITQRVMGRDDRQGRSWALLAILFILFTVDEIFFFHERSVDTLSRADNAGGLFFSSWVLLGIVLCFVIALLLLDFMIRLPAVLRRQFILAAALFIGGALVLEILAGVFVINIPETKITLVLYKLLVTTEEVLELVGLSLFIRALLLTMRSPVVPTR